jgi:hypothetical protein
MSIIKEEDKNNIIMMYVCDVVAVRRHGISILCLGELYVNDARTSQ